MPPERIGNSDMWRIPEGEILRGTNGEIPGPATVRIHRFGHTRQVLAQPLGQGGLNKVTLKTGNVPRYTHKITQNPS